MNVILWDIDGTILNTHGAGVLPLLSSFQKHTGIFPIYKRDSFSGYTDHQIVNKLLVENGLETNSRIINLIVDDYEINLLDALVTHKIEMLRDYKNILSELNAVSLVTNVITTGNTLKGAKAKLDAIGISNFFQHFFFSERLEPRFKILRRAVETFPPETKFCAIGDTPHDIEAAKLNSIPIIAVASGAYNKSQLEKFNPNSILEKDWNSSTLIEILREIWYETPSSKYI